MAVSDSHEQQILSPQAIIESNNPNFNESGKKAFGINVCNDDDVRFNLTHSSGSDITNMESEGMLTVNTGSKCNKDGTSYQVTSHHGNIGINADDGNILIKADGKRIVLEADEIILKGRKLVSVGDQTGSTRKVQIFGKNLEAVGSSGNITKVLSYHMLLETSALSKAAQGTCFSGASRPHPIVPRAKQADDN